MAVRNSAVFTIFALAVISVCSSSLLGDVGTFLKKSWCANIPGECCMDYFVRMPGALKEMQKALKQNFFGQHIAEETLFGALETHLEDKNPKKPLVLSFHGWPGSGKTFLAEILVKSLYREGVNSKYVKMYTASYHFPDAEKVQSYKKNLQEDIAKTLRSCPYSIFIFDEIDITPPQLFDSLVPFLDHLPMTGTDIDHKKAIYVFLSNIAASEINVAALESWKAGYKRESLAFNDFHSMVSAATFSSTGTGMAKTRLIDRHLVDYFIPFLPMEQKHVKKCAEAEIRRLNAARAVTPEFVARQLIYWPTELQLFSQSGCKRVESIVKYETSKSKWSPDEDDSSKLSKTEL